MKLFEPQLPAQERLRLLEENCDKKTVESYTRKLTADELADRREGLSDCILAIDAENDKLKDLRAQVKETMKPLQDEKKALLQQIKTKHAEQTGTLYHMINDETNMMEVYDSAGVLVSESKVRAGENTTIFGKLRSVI